MVEAVGNGRIVGCKPLLPDRQSALVSRQGGRELPALEMHSTEVVKR